jgi:hypothetical protein
MKIRALLLVVSVAALLAALVCAQGIIIERGAPGASGTTVAASGAKPKPPHWF